MPFVTAGAGMILRRRAGLFNTAIFVCILVAGCGETFRPVVTPVTPPGPDPQPGKSVIVISDAGSTGGVSTHIDLAADVKVGVARVGVNPVHAATFQGGTRVAVANFGSDSVSIYSTSSPSSQTVATASLPLGAKPVFLFTNQPGTTMFVAMQGSNSVVPPLLPGIGVVSVTSALFVNKVDTDGVPVAITGTADGNKLYSANADGSISVIDARNLTKTKTLSPGGSFVYATISSDSAYAYFVNSTGRIDVVKTSDDSLQPAVIVGANPSFAFFDARLQRLYVTNQGSNSVTIINADKNATGASPFLSVLATVPVGLAPKFVTALADGSKAYVSNSGSGNVSVINTLSNTLLRNVTVGTNPTNIVSSTDSTKVAVLNLGTNNVTSIRTTDDVVTQNVALYATVPNLTPQVNLTPVYLISQQ
jgi:YVTN family beta-propeller protein